MSRHHVGTLEGGIMKTSSNTYNSYVNEDGEIYFCPLSALKERRGVPANGLDECVEASTVGRYAGNLDVSD
jgi:hypothetical protein